MFSLNRDGSFHFILFFCSFSTYSHCQTPVPCHEGSYCARCEWSGVHPEQTEGWGCTQTCWIWGISTKYNFCLSLAVCMRARSHRNWTICIVFNVFKKISSADKWSPFVLWGLQVNIVQVYLVHFPESRFNKLALNSGLDKFKFSAPEIRSVNSALRACISNGAKSHH